MNKHLAKALKELHDAHGENVPDADAIMKAADGKEWSGKISGAGSWKLIKHSGNSYTTDTQIRS